jgi:hypothetical protein
MDFSQFTDKLKTLTPYLDQAKVYGWKALEFTARQAQGTPVFIQNEEEYNIHSSLKRSILIAYDDREKISQEILLRTPVWATKAWMDAATIRYLSISATPDLARLIGITTPIEMRIAYNGDEYLRSSDLETIKSWWDKRCYTTKVDEPNTISASSPEKTPDTRETNDPLANISKSS